ncbi:hypothetical protein [Peribacillus sp. NPDC097295]|uniref:hypothetical protein n=1 Tax=Peribacillus sp. NPDC097295 TaxID=3364402 RepID=UPI00382C9FE3
MKKIFCILFLISVFLIACSKDVDENDNFDENEVKDEVYLVFEGENENWEAEITFDQSVENVESASHIIRYIGKDPVPKKVHYQIGTLEANVELIDGIWEGGGKECECHTKPDEDILFNVEWNGRKEEFKLEHKPN